MIDIEKIYYKLAPSGRETCLTCTLPECVHVEPGPEPCPIDGLGRQEPDPARSTLRQVAKALDTLGYQPHVRELARQTGVSSDALYTLAKRGKLETKIVVRGRQRLRLVVGVNP